MNILVKEEAIRQRPLRGVLPAIFKILTIGVFFLMLTGIVNPIIAQADEMYFDDDGNLYFHTKDKKATGSTKYRTIGWVIKRYNMPMNATGQQYVIVTKSNYKADEPDPGNSNYVLCYFKTTRDEILDAVKSVSKEWYHILTTYGDDVYIDSVMTVVVSGSQRGTLYVGGSYTGEVYFTYEGIAGARNWSSPQSLKAHFDMVVRFPQLVRPEKTSVRELHRQPMPYSTNIMASFKMGAGDYGEEPYDITKGIPSGENMYLRGALNRAVYDLKLYKVYAQYMQTVSVPVTYILRWTDYYGKKQEETRVIYRYYQIVRDFYYYEVYDLDIYRLTGMEAYGSLIQSFSDNTLSDNINISEEVERYESAWGHAVGCPYTTPYSVETIVLNGQGYLKPSIPNADYRAYAETLVGDAYARNDKVIINGEVVLSDEPQKNGGKAPSLSGATNFINIYYNDLTIPVEQENGEYNDFTVKLTYVNDEGDSMEKVIDNFAKVTVHTPVVCDGEAFCDISANQALIPTSEDVVLGEELDLVFNDMGMHRTIRGYWQRSYTKYVGARQIKCPFAVIYHGTRYEKNTWITVDDYKAKLKVCEDNPEGQYTMYIRNIAYNGELSAADSNTEENANLSVSSYGAWNALNVRLIGKLNNLRLDSGDEVYNASDMPVPLPLSKDLSYSLSVDTVGEMMEGDYVEWCYTYYHEDRDGDFIPVDVYGVKDRNQIDGVILEALVEKDILGTDLCEKHNNKATWTVDKKVYGELIIVPQGTAMDEIQLAIREGRTSELFMTEGSVIVCVDIVSYKDGEPYLSYINEENAKKGYCNMWLKEGGTDTCPYGAVMRLELGNYTYYDYEVSGTH